MSQNKTQDSCHQDWNKLRQEILDRIDGIDKDTPAIPETEPMWWKEMMDIRRVVSNSKAIIK